MAVPKYADIEKTVKDLFSKDFYHDNKAALEVKTRASNGVEFTTSGKSDHKDAIGGKMEAKYADKASGFKLTHAWLHNNSLETKVELEDNILDGLKTEVDTRFNPSTSEKLVKVGLQYGQPKFTARAYFDVLKGLNFLGDVSVSHEGCIAGGKVDYDVAGGRITDYATSFGYSVPAFTACVSATNKLSVFHASYAHTVTNDVQAGAKATWDSKKANNNVLLELGSKYIIDRYAYAKFKINNNGIAALSYTQALRPGVKLGLGLSFDTQKLNEASQKVGLSFIVDL